MRFKAAYVSGAYTTRAGPVQIDTTQYQMLPYGLSYAAPRTPESAAPQPRSEPTAPAETLLDLIVLRLAGRGAPARQVWLPPLAVPSTLEDLLPRLTETDRGLRPADWDGVPPLTVPIGLVDKPFQQRRDPMWLDLATAHFLVAGGPQSGKSTVVRTLVSSLSLTHTPEQVQFYCLDFGGGTLTGLGDLPHVGSVATRREPQRVRRTITEINGLLERREQLFTQYRVDSMASYRRLSDAGQVPRDGFGDVFLVVDGWGTIRSDFEEMEQQITQIAARGLGFGVHVALSIQRWMEIRPALRDLISSRLELRLGDPTESDVDRRAAANVSDRITGPRPEPRQAALPGRFAAH